MRAPDEVLTALRRPCVYAWMRGEVCLYVGSTIEGPASRLRHHHVINRIEVWRTGDRLDVWLVAPDESLNALERAAILELSPTLNARIPLPVQRGRDRAKRNR